MKADFGPVEEKATQYPPAPIRAPRSKMRTGLIIGDLAARKVQAFESTVGEVAQSFVSAPPGLEAIQR